MKNLILCLLLVFVLHEEYLNVKANPRCLQQNSCDTCLVADPACSWCTDIKYNKRKPRCMTETELLLVGCDSKFIEKNVVNTVEITENQPAFDYSLESQLAIQLTPQRAKLKLKKMQTQRIKMTYKPAKNYPLDLYYLMDLTFSMKSHKATLVNIGNRLANSLDSLTNGNYRLAFGSFCDKPSMPYILTSEHDIENPCSVEGEVCEKTYSFKHRLSFTEDVTKFIKHINTSSTTGNLDNLEGGLDALMQIIVCGKQIGWTKNSRKIVVFATDGMMHFAGDGLLAGIIEKNDGTCHLSPEGDYLAALQMDYPSLAEINRKLEENKISVIFTVTKDVLNIYDQIHNLMPDVSNVGSLDMDSSNILELVSDGYKAITKKASFKDNSPDNILVTYETDCGGLYLYQKEQSFCNNIEGGKEYDIWVNITLLDYPNNMTDWQSIKIEESSLSGVELNLDISFEESCSCLKEVKEKKSEYCNGFGTEKCGLCDCETGWVGKYCDCNLQNNTNFREKENLCRKPNLDDEDYEDGTLGPICSNRGECNCGICECLPGVEGQYCDCRECPRDRDNDEICGNRGTCDCGNCLCDAGWSGETCKCSTSKLTCKAPNSEFICSEKGSCNCGKCECNENYYGKFCETSADSSNAVCSYFEACVQCHILRKESNNCTDIDKKCSSPDGKLFITEFFSDISLFNVTCITRMINDKNVTCQHTFSYEVNDGRTLLRIVLSECTGAVNTAMVGGFIVLGTLLLGLLILIVIKLRNDCKDKIEFARFEEEKIFTNYNESPIYNSPIRHYEVPQFNDNRESLRLDQFSSETSVVSYHYETTHRV